MKQRRWAAVALTALGLWAGQARAQGIPVMDLTTEISAIQQVIAWAEQYQQMVESLQSLSDQLQQARAMTAKLDAARGLGSILNDPRLGTLLPPEMQDAARLLTTPGYSVSPAALASILGAYGVAPGRGGVTPGQGAADMLSKMQGLLASGQQRDGQVQQLAARVDASPDAKSSLDLLNRNTIESVNVSNQLVQAIATIEANRQAQEIRNIAENQARLRAKRAAILAE